MQLDRVFIRFYGCVIILIQKGFGECADFPAFSQPISACRNDKEIPKLKYTHVNTRMEFVHRSRIQWALSSS